MRHWQCGFLDEDADAILRVTGLQTHPGGAGRVCDAFLDEWLPAIGRCTRQPCEDYVLCEEHMLAYLRIPDCNKRQRLQ